MSAVELKSGRDVAGLIRLELTRSDLGWRGAYG